MTRFCNLLLLSFLLLIPLLPTMTSAAVPGAKLAARTIGSSDEVKEGEPVRAVGRVVARDEQDDEGNLITRAFLEQDDGGLIELPCERKKSDGGLARKAAGKVIGDDSCWDYLGQEVEVLGSAQKLTRKGKRWLRLGRLTGINPL